MRRCSRRTGCAYLRRASWRVAAVVERVGRVAGPDEGTELGRAEAAARVRHGVHGL